MPILVHSRASSFPFRRRRASSPARRVPPTAELLNTPAGHHAPADSSPHTKKPSSASHSDLNQLYRQPLPAAQQSSTSRLLRPFRRPSTHFEKLQAKMSSVRLRSSNSTPRLPEASSHSDLASALPPAPHSPIPPYQKLLADSRRPWETIHAEERMSTFSDTSLPPPIAPSPSLVSVSLDHHSDASSHLTLGSEPSSNKPSPWNLPPALDLGLSFNSPSLFSGLPYGQESPSSDSFPPGSSNHTSGPVLDGSLPSTSESAIPLSGSSKHPGMTCSLPRSQQQPFRLSESIDRSPMVSSYVNRTSSSLTSRVRPTPSPRTNAGFGADESEVDSPPPTLPSSLRDSTLSTPLRALPLLNSYHVTSNQVRHSSDSSGSSLGERGSAEFDVEVEDQAGSESDDTDGASDDGELPQATHDSPEQLAMLTPKVPTQAGTQSTGELTTATCPHEWISFDTDTPSVSQVKTTSGLRSQQLSASTSSPASCFDPSSNVKAEAVQSPGERARHLLLSSTSSSAAPPPPPTRPTLASHWSQSASRLHKITVSQHPTENPSVIISPSLTPVAKGMRPLQLTPPENVLQNAILLPAGVTTLRHHSMYEIRPILVLPSYEASLQNAGIRRNVVVPREEEGHEKLPPYSCAIHLEGWMPRKMEFKAPGVQAKDRAWKRQYVVVHGTMIRIYRSDPHTHAVSGAEDPYSSNFVHGKSISPLSSKCGISTKTDPSSSSAPPLHFHQGQYDSAPVTSLKEAALVKASQLPTHHNYLHRVYSLQNAESGLAADYVKKKYIVRVRAEGEQFLLQAKDDRGVIDLIEALQAATNVSLDLDLRALPKFITLPRRRRRRRIVPGDAPGPAAAAPGGAARRVAGHALGAAVVEGMVAEAAAHGPPPHWADDEHGDRMSDMLAEEQDAYMHARS
ncbi:hypothetical protein PtA15_12A73 [Puccinia triticina]|uniref:PH domain-containing protein n=1 Tax=Puccinia triticina TaxID=208348 RepID=A0ABY7D0G4_9BASI|nr:uncharacterized protein PtA15_12A73 [Puccinia triticina]WAQ90088.1 hypothetical protein PtA15_12A73 [Puccinia triticina]